MAEKRGSFIRMNFSYAGFSRVMNEKTVSPFTPDRAALLALGKFLATKKNTREEPIQFVSIPEFRGLDYVGYIIEKERLNRQTGIWERLEEYRVMGGTANSFRDSRVAYGETYRYRVRSVVKFTTNKNEAAISNLEVVQQLVDLAQKQIKSTTDKNSGAMAYLSQVGLQAKNQADTTVKIADHIQIGGKLGQATAKLSPPPITEQTRANQLLGNLEDIQKALASGQALSKLDLATLENRLKSQGFTLPEKKEVYVSEYYCSLPNRNWMYVSVTEEVLPPPPETIKIVPMSAKRAIGIYWVKPANNQRDIDKFNIYRREALGQDWQLLAKGIPETVGSFIDRGVSTGRKYIYALTCTDKHGFESFLSTQIQAELNPSFEFEKKEKPLVWISGAGARKDEPDLVFRKYYNRSEQIIARDNIYLRVSKKFTDTTQKLLLKVRSLDTHEIQEIVVTLTNKNVNDK